MTGSTQLRDQPGCEKCGRSGQYRKVNLIAQFGADIALPDLRHEIAKCERHQKTGDACAVHFVSDLEAVHEASKFCRQGLPSRVSNEEATA